MQQCPIVKVVIDSKGKLFVCPGAEKEASYEFVYREASGLRWDKQEMGLCAYEPSRWRYEELLLHIIATLRESQNDNLYLTAETTWVGVSPEVKKVLVATLAQTSSHERDA